MNSVVEQLERLEAEIASVLAGAFAAEVVAGMPDAEVMGLLEVTGRLQRRIEAVQVEATVQVRERSEGLRGERMTSAYGCDRPADLLRMVLHTDRAGAHRLVAAAGLTARVRGITDGEFLPARYDALRRALNDGVIGLAGFLAATDPLERSRKRILDEARVEADRQLAAFARGIAGGAGDGGGEDVEDAGMADAAGAAAAGHPAPAPTPDELGQFARVLAAYLDPDGAEPKDELASRGRSLRLGRERDGRVSLRGELLPEVAAQLNRLLDSLLSPRVGEVPVPDGVHFIDSQHDEAWMPVDDRTRPQKQHDAFAAILMTAARSGEMPDVGGAPPTLVVTVSASAYATGEGWAHVDGTDVLVPVRVAAQTACAGGVQRVLFDERGRIVSIGTSARIFNALQRRAILTRDGGCIIPGCTVPATWCEIHHVRDAARGGPTHTDNGVALCWHHHRTLHLSEWQIRMRHGVPEIRGPAWWDRERRWRPAGRQVLRSSPAASCG
ncbi:HNH endonuclease signature motif containing protein [Microbacterium neungamense]|uniref:HNH endonuclease signature motif containing protein n=1 Tax=Microbacterium neungamense TaxID=2810535 RepID=UPI00217EDB14|nr:HNH endonuclease signature motif containing protein [Microbacterium neungamense]UWF76956.1 DUF222 domain-containing protein [Microbacterium neungamense]